MLYPKRTEGYIFISVFFKCTFPKEVYNYNSSTFFKVSDNWLRYHKKFSLALYFYVLTAFMKF